MHSAGFEEWRELYDYLMENACSSEKFIAKSSRIAGSGTYLIIYLNKLNLFFL
jgi:hypothetical protein